MRAANVYRNIPIFAVGFSSFFFSRGGARGGYDPADRIPRKYELLNLDKGSRLVDVLAENRAAPRRAGPLQQDNRMRRTPCNQAQSRRLLIYTSGLVKRRATSHHNEPRLQKS